MTIEDTIALYRKLSTTNSIMYKANRNTLSQIATWLEELRVLRKQCNNCFERRRYEAEAKKVNKIYNKAYNQGKADAIDDAIHHLDNAKVNCHEDYIDGIDFSIGVLKNILEQVKEQKNE